jgi:hypothetical protein
MCAYLDDILLYPGLSWSQQDKDRKSGCHMVDHGASTLLIGYLEVPVFENDIPDHQQ